MKKVFAVIIFMLSLIVLVGCINEEEPTPTPEKTLVAISVKTAPTQSTYELGATFSTDGLVVEAFYSDGSTAILAASQYTLSGFNANQSGAQTITITSGGKTASFNVVVSDPDAPVTLLALQIQNLPYQTMYAVNGTINTDGLVVLALYSDGSKRTLEQGEPSLSFPLTSTIGSKDVTVAFQSVSAKFKVEITDLVRESDEEVTVNTAINYQGRGILYKETTPYEALNGKTYSENSLLPVWETIGDMLNINFVDAKQSDSTDNQFNAYATAGFVGADVINTTSSKLSEYGVTGNFVDLSKYLGYMPNLNKFLRENPSVRASMTSANGGIYYTPYFDGFGEIEQMFLMRIDWVQDILDVASPTFDTSVFASSMTVQKFTPNTLDVDVTVANPDGTTRVVTKERSQNILDILSGLTSKTGATMANAFRTYIQDVYGDQGYTNLSDVFVGTDAAYDTDELVALMYVIKANPQFLTREFGTGSNATAEPRTSIEVYFPRDKTDSRVRNLLRGLEMYGARGVFSRYEWAYYNQNGEVEDSRVQSKTLDAVDQLQRMYTDALMPTDFETGTFDYRLNFLSGSYGFMTYDYNASSTPTGYIADAVKLDPTFRFEAVLPPVVDWFENGEYFHFSEATRAVKSEAWGIPKHVEANPVKLSRILTLFDQLYDYSSNDSIGNIHLYGPAGWIDGTVDYNGVEIPAISDEAMAEMASYGKGVMINYLRNFVGATMPIGHIRSLGLEFQTLSPQGIAGIERINVAVQANTFRLAGIYKSDNPWYQLVPTAFALTADDYEDFKALTYDDIWAVNKLKILVKYGFTGEGTSVTRTTYLTTMVTKDDVNTYEAIYKKALNEAIARVKN